jgi:lysophospholipase
LDPAPFHEGLADGPEGGAAFWLRADDGVRLRAAVWGRDRTNGTILIYPGRCEYAEKYGRTVKALVDRGYACAAIDWRGQGKADRLLPDPNVGHVGAFSDYQRDTAAYLGFAQELGLPEPFFLLGHSMGGCIGLRHLIDGSPFRAASFSAPMWGIAVAPKLRPVAMVVPPLARALGLGTFRTPSTSSASYLLDAPFEDNMLTTDREMWDYMTDQVREDPQFRLGGPSLQWFAEAVDETKALARAPLPTVPAHASVGSLERIVSSQAIETIMSNWSNGTFTRIDGAEHEILMEKEPLRAGFLDRTIATFEAA